MIRVRFAPSPTGFLHQGNVRTALFNFLFAKREGGALILRIEDTDQERSQENYASSISEDLRWLGLQYEEGPDQPGSFGPYVQSQRQETYQKYLNQLMASGKAYACYCTAEELDNERRRAMATGKSYQYSGKCRELKDEEKQEKNSAGLVPTYRFRVDREIVKFDDLVYGEKVFDTLSIGDFIIARGNGIPVYLFACAVDDCLMQISHVIRGEDGISNTPRQILIQRALGLEPPQFCHLPLILGPDHALLSKRNGSTPVAEFKQKGYLPEALLNYLALLGWSPPDNKEILSLAELTEKFDLKRVARSSAVFDWAKLNHINHVHLRRLSEAEYLKAAKENLAADQVDLTAYGESLDATLLALRPNVQTLSELKNWLILLYNDPDLQSPEALEILKVPETKKVLENFGNLVEAHPEELGKDDTDRLMEELKKKTKLKGKKLFLPLRIALTGGAEGPELAALIPSLGKAKVLGRVRRALETL